MRGHMNVKKANIMYIQSVICPQWRNAIISYVQYVILMHYQFEILNPGQ
jgi:hypothetical protein